MTSYTVIDSDDYAAHGINAFFFPGGEPHVQFFDIPTGRILLFLKLRTWNDCGLAVCLIDVLKRQGVDFETFIPYFPGARQDRTTDRTPLTVDIMRAMLYSSGWQSASVFDPHSNPRRWVHYMPSDLKLTLPHFDGVIAPDEGARARAEDFALHYTVAAPIIQCEKVREFDTGRITAFKMPPLRHEGRYIIVDDICDGGATFNMLAVAFTADYYAPASELQLWVSHGIFSRGVINLRRDIRRIYTTDSFARVGGDIGTDQSRVKVFPLQPLFDKIMGVTE